MGIINWIKSIIDWIRGDLDEKLIPVQNGIGDFFKKIAKVLGYPENPGMPISGEFDSRSKFLDSLPIHKTIWPPFEKPQTWVETIFGSVPKVEAVQRYSYTNLEEGFYFYSFYIKNYKNIYFLPDWLSEFIQVRLHICVDITVLERIRESLFVGLAVYSTMILLRILLAWFISINPYTFPWYYLVATVDWTEEILQGIVPAILGVNITASLFLGIIGEIADSLNHLVFTMPFLPSEGKEDKLPMGQDILVFHDLPTLWYRYPIPNELREFWYKYKPEILDYMGKIYTDLNIQFFPDGVIQ